MSDDKYSGLTARELYREVEELDSRIHEITGGNPERLRELGDEELRRVDDLVRDRKLAMRKLERHRDISNALDKGRGVVRAYDNINVTTRTSPFDSVDVHRLSDDEARDRALRALEERGRHLEPAQQSQVDKLLRTVIDEENPNLDGSYVARRMLITESDTYRSAFAQMLTAGLRGRPVVLSAEEALSVRELDRLEMRTMLEGSGTAGLGVPVLIDPSIVLTAQESGSELMRISRVVPVTTSVWKGVTSAGVTWSFDTEGTAVSDDSPVLAQPVVSVGTARGFLPYSLEIGQDYPSFAEEMFSLLSEGYDELVANALIQGAGVSNGPIGIATALEANTNVQLVVTTASLFPVADVYRIWKSLPKRARRRATWLSSQDTQNRVRQFGSGTAGTQDSNFSVDMVADSIQRLMGREFIVDDFVDDLPASGTAASTFLIVGNFSRYLVAKRAGLSIEPIQNLLDTTTGRPTGVRGLFAWARLGADSIDDGAFRCLVNKTS